MESKSRLEGNSPTEKAVRETEKKDFVLLGRLGVSGDIFFAFRHQV